MTKVLSWQRILKESDPKSDHHPMCMLCEVLCIIRMTLVSVDFNRFEFLIWICSRTIAISNTLPISAKLLPESKLSNSPRNATARFACSGELKKYACNPEKLKPKLTWVNTWSTRGQHVVNTRNMMTMRVDKSKGFQCLNVSFQLLASLHTCSSPRSKPVCLSCERNPWKAHGYMAT